MTEIIKKVERHPTDARTEEKLHSAEDHIQWKPY